MVDVAHDGNDGRTRHQLAGILVGEREELLARGGDDGALALGRLDRDDVLALDRVHCVAELVGNDLGGREVDDLVDRRHDVGGHQLLDDLDRAHGELVGQVLDGQRRREHDLAVAVGLDLDRHRGGLEGRAGGLDRSRRQRRRRVTSQPPLLEEVHQLLLADAEFAREFVSFHAGTSNYPQRRLGPI